MQTRCRRYFNLTGLNCKLAQQQQKAGSQNVISLRISKKDLSTSINSVADCFRFTLAFIY